MRPRGRQRQAKLLLGGVAALAAIGALTGCDAQEDANLERGEQLFVQKCGTCHALSAAGTNADVGPDLEIAFKADREAGMDQDTIEGVVEGQIANPRPADEEDTEVYMPADLVTGEDAEDVAAYVASVAGLGIPPPEFVAPEFFATNCGGCHTLGAAGTTGTTGPDLDQALAGQSPDQVAMSITDPEAQLTPGFDPVMPTTYDETLTEPQLQQLVAFLLGQGGEGGGAGSGGGK